MTRLTRKPPVSRMKYIYMDNFRGFRNTCVPIVDVNFLVGENSSGKTSLMMVPSEFMFQRITQQSEFSPAGEGAPRLGHFLDCVSAHSSDRSQFTIGYVGESRPSKDEPAAGEAMLLTYRDIDGAPRISRLSCTTPSGETKIEFLSSKAFYKNEKKRRPANAGEARVRLLAWAKEHKKGRDDSWSEFPESSGPVWDYPLVLILTIANRLGESETQEFPSGSMPLRMPPTAPHVVYIAPIRSQPQGTYTYDKLPPIFSAEGEHIPYVIKKMLESEKEKKRFKKFMREVGAASGLFQQIAITRWGRETISPFEIDAYLDNVKLAIKSLGYGVSQSLPIFVNLFEKQRNSWFAIQQPEVHLHPRAQAALGDTFYKMATEERKKFLIETHSDFTIDRFRLNYRLRKEGSRPVSQILFFERKEKHNTVTPIEIGPTGELASSQPESYRHFFIKEEMNILGLR